MTRKRGKVTPTGRCNAQVFRCTWSTKQYRISSQPSGWIFHQGLAGTRCKELGGPNHPMSRHQNKFSWHKTVLWKKRRSRQSSDPKCSPIIPGTCHVTKVVQWCMMWSFLQVEQHLPSPRNQRPCHFPRWDVTEGISGTGMTVSRMGPNQANTPQKTNKPGMNLERDDDDKGFS